MRRSFIWSLVLVVAIVAPLAGSAASAATTTPPRYVNLPTIHTVRVGQTLTASPGQWNGSTPMTFYYQWLYGKPGSSTPIAGANGPTYTLRPGDAGKHVWVQVKAINSAGHFWANSEPTPTIAGPDTAGGITLPDGRISMPVAQVHLPNRLTLATPLFDPLRMKANGSATLQVTVVDRYRRPVHGAQVKVTALPFGSLQVVKPALTNANGIARITLRGRPKVLDHVPGTSIALYLQATAPGGSATTGIGGTRLVELKFSH